ncbi:MAG: hypothetical protein SGJ00_02495 [bacterium]|nr:hypothetical protein [bacterium]
MMNKILKYFLIVFALFLVTTTSINAQYYDEDEIDYEDEEIYDGESSFFKDGLNNQRFGSSLNNNYQNKPSYHISRNKNVELNEVDGYSQKEISLDLNVHKNNNTTNQSYNVVGSGGGSTPGNPPQTYLGVGTNNGIGAINNNGQVKQPNSGVPINPGDPDAPIDGGIGLLLGAGAAYGLKVMRKKKKTDSN